MTDSEYGQAAENLSLESDTSKNQWLQAHLRPFPRDVSWILGVHEAVWTHANFSWKAVLLDKECGLHRGRGSQERTGSPWKGLAGGENQTLVSLSLPSCKFNLHLAQTGFRWSAPKRESEPCVEERILPLELLQFILLKCLALLGMATPAAHGGSQARGLTEAPAAGPRHSHSQAGSEPCLPPTPQLKLDLNIMRFEEKQRDEGKDIIQRANSKEFPRISQSHPSSDSESPRNPKKGR